MTRRVVLLCGPPGSGKTTAARASGLEVFDRDDAKWSSEKHFRTALRHLGSDPTARAVVIRSGATSSARAAAARMVDATETYLVWVDADECQRRAHQRARGDARKTTAAVPQWFAAFDRDDNVPTFPGWDSDDLTTSEALRPSRKW